MSASTHPERVARTDFHTCETCGKRAYHTRTAAKAARASLGDHTLSIYRCAAGAGFHLGHLAAGITRQTARRRAQRGDPR